MVFAKTQWKLSDKYGLDLSPMMPVADFDKLMETDDEIIMDNLDVNNPFKKDFELKQAFYKRF